MELNSIVLLAQWGIVLLFVLFHFFLGFKRGTSKSLYYFVISLIMTVVTLLLVSMITIRVLYTPTSLISQVKGLWDAFPTEYEAILADPGVGAVIFALVDLVVKIVAFFILYPIVKFVLTLVFFKPIWTRGIEPKLSKNPNAKKRVVLIDGQAKNYDLVPVGHHSRKNKTLSSRFVGGGIGMVRGFLVAFLLLLPMTVLASMVSPLSTPTTPTASVSGSNATTGDNAQMVNDILDALKDFNHLGVGAFSRQIRIGDKNLDKYIFDKVFTTKIKEKDKTTKLNIANEVEAFVNVGKFLIDRGLLDDGFDYETITKDDLADLEILFDGLKGSTLIDAVIPIATKVLINEYLTEELGFDFYGSEDSVRALDAFNQIKWAEELDRIYDVVSAVLEFASVKDLLAYADDPKSLTDLSPAQGAMVADAIEALSKLETLVLLNAGADYARSNEDVLEFIDWLPENERQDYINNRTAFMTEDLKYLQIQLGKLSDVVKAVFDDEYSGDLDLAYIIDNISDPNVILSDDPVYSAWINQVLLSVIDLDLVVKSMPIAVDYSIYTFLGEDFEETLVDKLANALDDTAWEGELTNIADVYKQVLSLGLSTLFADDADMIDAIDTLLEEMAKSSEGLSAIKGIATSIFEGSDAINRALEILTPALVDKFVDDEELAVLIKDGLGISPITGETDFNYGKEIIDVLTIAESFYQFATIGTFTNQTLDANVALDLLAGFGGLTSQQFNSMTTKITNLQLVTRLNGDILSYVKESMSLDFLYVPETVVLKNDLNTILNLAYEAGKFANAEVADGIAVEDIDFTPLLSNETFRSYLTVTPQNRHSSLLMANMAYNLMDLSTKEDIFIDYISIPTQLANSPVESVLWRNELNKLINGVFDLGETIGNDPSVTLSLNGIKDIADDPMGLPVSIVTQFRDQTLANKAFGQLESSLIYRSSVPKVLNQFSDGLDELIPGYVLNLPANSIDADGIKVGMLSELIMNAADVLFDMNYILGLNTLDQVTKEVDTEEFLIAFNYVSETKIDALGRTTLIEGLVGEALLNQAVLDFAYDKLGENDLPVDVFSGNLTFDAAYTNGVLNQGEVSKILLAAQSLQIPGYLIMDFNEADLIDYVKSVNDAMIDKVFESKIIHQMLTNVVNSPNLESYVVNLATDAFNDAASNETMLDGLTIDFNALFAVVVNQKDAAGLFDQAEIKNLVSSFNALELESLDDLEDLGINSISEYYEKTYNGQNAYYYLTNTAILRGIITTLVVDENILDWVYDLAEEQLNPALADLELVLNDIVKKSDIVGLQITNEFQDQNGYLRQSDLYDVLAAVSALKLHVLLDNDNLTSEDIIAYVYTLNNQAFASDQRDVLGFIYSMRYVENALSSMMISDEVNDAVLELLNDQLAGIAADLNYTFRALTSNDLKLSYDLIDEDSIRGLLNAVEQTGIESIDEVTAIKNIDDVAQLLNLDLSSALLYDLLDTTLIKFVLNTVLVSDVWSSYVTQLVNDLLADTDLVDLSIDESLIQLDSRLFVDGVIETRHLVDLVLAVYATDYEVNDELTPAFITNLVNNGLIAGEFKYRIDHILDSEILFTYIDKLFADMAIKQAIADVVEEQALNAGFELSIDYQLLVAPSQALDQNGRLKRNEIVSLLEAFGELELVAWDDFDNFSDLTYVSNKVNDTLVVDKLLQSDWVYYVLGGLLVSDDNKEAAAEALTNLLKDELDIDFTVNASMFRFGALKYDVVNPTGQYQGYFKREEIKQLIKSGLRLDYTTMSFSTNNDIYQFIDTLLEAGSDNVRNIDYIFESKVLVGLFDKLFNAEANASLNLNELYAELANKYVPEISSEVRDLTVTKELFNFKNVSNANGVFDPSHLISLVEFAQVVDFDNLTANYVFDLFDKDANNNSQRDIKDLFKSNLLLSLVTNALQDTSIRSFAVDYLDDLIADQNIELLDDLSLDVEAYLVALGDVVDANGLFDYNDLIRVRNVLRQLGINSVDDFDDVDVNGLTTLANQNIDGSDYLSYISQTNLVRFLVDVSLKQDGLYQYLSDLVFDQFEVRIDPSQLEISGYDDSTGRLKASELYDLLMAGAAVDIKAIRDNEINPAFISKFLDRPVASSGFDRIGLIYGSKIITDLLRSTIENDELQDEIVSILSGELQNILNDMGVSVRLLTKDDLGLTYDLVDESSIRSMVAVFKQLNFASFDAMQQLSTVRDYAAAFGLEVSNELLIEALDTPIVSHLLNTVLLSDIWPTLVADFVNTKVLNDYDVEIDDSFFEIDRNQFVVNGKLSSTDIAQMLISAYAVGFDVDRLFSVRTIKRLESYVVINGLTKQRLYHVLDSDILFDYINRLAMADEVKEILAEIIEVEAAKNDLTLNLDPAKMNIPGYILDNTSRFKKAELMRYVIAFNALELTKFGDLTDVKLLYSKIHSTNVIEKLFDTDLFYGLINESLNDDKIMNDAATKLNDLASEKLGIYPNISGEFFKLDDAKYGLYDSGNMKRAEMVQLILSLTVVDWLEVDLSSPTAILNALNKTKDSVVNIDYMMTSKALVAIFDKVLNFNEQTKVRDFAVSYVNKLASEYNDLSGLVLTDSVLEIQADAFDINGVLKADEIIKIVRAANMINYSNTVDFKSFSNLIGKDSNSNAIDDFDELLASKFVHSLISNALTDDGVLDYLALKINDVQTTITFTKEILEFDPSVMDGSLVKVSELKNAVIAVDAIGFKVLTGETAINLATFTSLIDRNMVGTKDDLERVLDSGIIYVVLTKAFELHELNTLADEQLTQVLGKVFNSFEVAAPEDALGTVGIELNKFSKAEIRALMNSLKLLNIGTDLKSISPSMFTDLIGANIVGTKDDLDRVLDSKYLVDKLDLLLQSEGFVELLAQSLFDPNDFAVPSAGTELVGTRNRLTSAELRSMFVALDVLGITDFASPNVSVTTLTSLTQIELDQVLESNYLYAFIDLTLKNQSDITVPADALEVAGTYSGMIKLTEISSLFNALTVLNITDLTNFSVDTVTVAKLQELHDLNSAIIDQAISDAIAEELDSVPAVSYDTGRIKRTEVQALIDSLVILSVSDLSQTISVSSVTTAKLDELHQLNSPIVNRLLSTGIIDSIGRTNIPDAAYSLTSDLEAITNNKLDLDDAEIGKIILALGDLNVNLSAGITVSTLTPASIKLAVNRDSITVNRLVSTELISNLSTVPTSSFVVGSTEDITKIEILDALESLIILNISNLSGGITTTNITPTEIDALIALDSRLVDRMVSKAILDSSIVIPATALAELGDINYDANHIGKDIKISEISALVDAMQIMGITDITVSMDAQTITIAQLQQLDLLNSIIVDRVISTAIIQAMTVPTGSYTDASQKDLLASEQTGMISALLILANNDSSKTMNDLTLTTITPANLTTSKLDDLLNIDVLIVYRLVSSGVIGANIDTPESLAVLGDPNFDANAAGDDVKKAELLALIDVMTILGVTNVGDIAASITYATIDSLAPADVTTLMAAPNTIVYHLISDMLIDHIGAAGIALLPDGDFVSPAKTRFTRLAIIAYIND